MKFRAYHLFIMLKQTESSIKQCIVVSRFMILFTETFIFTTWNSAFLMKSFHHHCTTELI